MGETAESGDERGSVGINHTIGGTALYRGAYGDA